MSPVASIIIRAKNEALLIGRTLQAINTQTYRDFEVIVIDSGSTDATVEMSRALGARVIEIAPEDFTYGRALNIGAQEACGRYLVHLSAHAPPVDEFWLASLITAIERPNGVERETAAVYGRQIAFPDADPLVVCEMEACYGLESRVQVDDPFFSNANALLRRDLVLACPFDEYVPYCEDQIWAKAQLAAGYAIVYEPAAAVFHSHNETTFQVFRRKRAEGRGLRYLGMKPWPWFALPNGIVHAVRRDWKAGAISSPGGLLRAAVFRSAQLLGTQWGLRGW